MYEIEFTPEAVEDLRSLRRFAQRLIQRGIEDQLLYEPGVSTSHRKRLRPNEVAEWELKIGRFRVFYNVDDSSRVVSIEALGLKIGNRLYIRGKKREV